MHKETENKDLLVLEILKESQTLKSMVEVVEEEFKRKGEYDPETRAYVRIDGIFFKSEKYANETAVLFFQKAEKVFELLKARFSLIPFKINLEMVTYRRDSRSDKQLIKVKGIENYRSITFLDVLTFFSYHGTETNQIYQGVSFKEKWKENSILHSLVTIGERIDDKDTLKELDKPLFIALARILQSPLDRVSIKDFYEFKSNIIKKAIDMGKKTGCLYSEKDEVYSIIKRPTINISCPVCEEVIPAHLDNCPNCRFNIRNFVIKDETQKEDYVPEKWFKYDKAEGLWIAYFRCNIRDEVISLSESVFVRVSEIMIFAINKLKGDKVVHEVPLVNTDFYLEHYTTTAIRCILIPIVSETDYLTYSVKADSIFELQNKIKGIIKTIEFYSKQYYHNYITYVKSYSEKERLSPKDFINKVFLYCYENFHPSLNEHPILQEIIEEEGIPGDYVTLSGINIHGYTITDIIGKGGFGEVYKAKRDIDGQTYALKVPCLDMHETMDTDQITALLKEVKIWKELDHTNIVKIIDYNFKGIPYLAMEYLEGGSLRKIIKEGRDLRFIIKVILEVANALQHAHMCKVIHRDIKPENVLFTTDGIAKVADWGLAKVLITTSAKYTTEFKGTLIYCAPEQIFPEDYGETDQRTDIYQLGCLSYEALTGKPPFESDNPARLINHILNTTPEKPSKINKTLCPKMDEIILKALAKKKDERFEQVTDFKSAVETEFSKIYPS